MPIPIIPRSPQSPASQITVPFAICDARPNNAEKAFLSGEELLPCSFTYNRVHLRSAVYLIGGVVGLTLLDLDLGLGSRWSLSRPVLLSKRYHQRSFSAKTGGGFDSESQNRTVPIANRATLEANRATL